MDEAEVVEDVALIADDKATEVAEPGKAALDLSLAVVLRSGRPS